MEFNVGLHISINRPEWFKRADFLKFLNSPGTATWHHAGQQAGEYSDVFLLVDPSLDGEGPESSELPEDIWNEVVAAATKASGYARGISQDRLTHHAVRVTNL